MISHAGTPCESDAAIIILLWRVGKIPQASVAVVIITTSTVPVDRLRKYGTNSNARSPLSRECDANWRDPPHDPEELSLRYRWP